MKRTHPTTWLMLLCAALFAIACATMSVRDQLAFGYSAVDAYMAGVEDRVLRGAMTKEQATKAVDNAKQTKAKLDRAREAAARCNWQMPCPDFVNLLPDTRALERELRAKEQ